MKGSWKGGNLGKTQKSTYFVQTENTTVFLIGKHYFDKAVGGKEDGAVCKKEIAAIEAFT